MAIDEAGGMLVSSRCASNGNRDSRLLEHLLALVLSYRRQMQEEAEGVI